MKTAWCVIAVGLSILLSSCEVEPTAEFETDFAANYNWLQPAYKDLMPRYETFEGIRFINKSLNGDQYFWDFGDGQYSTDMEPVIRYEKGGEYTVVLRVLSETGSLAISTKQVRIYERVVRKISIQLQTWGHNLHRLEDFGWTHDKVGDVIFEMGILGPTDFDIPSTILYTSDTIKDMSAGAPVVSFFPKNHIQIDFKMHFFNEEPRRNYVLILYAIEDNERTMFYSSKYHPGLRSYYDYETGWYKFESGTTIEIECAFE